MCLCGNRTSLYETLAFPQQSHEVLDLVQVPSLTVGIRSLMQTLQVVSWLQLQPHLSKTLLILSVLQFLVVVLVVMTLKVLVMEAKVVLLVLLNQVAAVVVVHLVEMVH